MECKGVQLVAHFLKVQILYSDGSSSSLVDNINKSITLILLSLNLHYLAQGLNSQLQYHQIRKPIVKSTMLLSIPGPGT